MQVGVIYKRKRLSDLTSISVKALPDYTSCRFFTTALRLASEGGLVVYACLPCPQYLV